MKKSVLIVSLLMAGSTAAFSLTPKAATPLQSDQFSGVKTEISAPARVRANADEAINTYNYALCQDPENPYTAYSLNGTSTGQIMYQCFEISKEAQKDFIGATINGLNITVGSNSSGVNNNTQIGVFVAEDLSVGMVRKQLEKISKEGYATHYVAFDEPYTITGETNLYVGYYFKLSASSGYYMPTDGVPTSASVNGLYAGYTTGTKMPTNWKNYSNQIGCATIAAVLGGNGINFPQNRMEITSAEAPAYIKPGSPFTYAIRVVNRGQNSADNITVTTTLNNGETADSQVTLSEVCPTNGVIELEVDAMTITADGLYEATGSVSKVNDVANVFADKAVSCLFTSYTDGFDRNIVVEEATGNWCGYCPAGIVMMEYLKEKYDDRVFRIAVHGGSNNEPMLCTTYNGWLSDYISGFPQALANRYYFLAPTSGTIEAELDAIYSEYTSYPAYAKIEMTGEVSKDGKSAKIDSNTEFSFSTDQSHLLSFAVVADGVGPYKQANYFSGSGMMGYWGLPSTPESVSTIYDDVAISLKSYPGIKNSLPAQIEKGQTYNYGSILDIANVKTTPFKVIAMITNAMTGEIVNAAQISLEKDTAVAEIAESGITVNAENGIIEVNGANDVKVYTLSGTQISDNARTQVAAGLYIVRADGQSLKVIVK